jgi:hypothetical protein
VILLRFGDRSPSYSGLKPRNRTVRATEAVIGVLDCGGMSESPGLHRNPAAPAPRERLSDRLAARVAASAASRWLPSSSQPAQWSLQVQ